MRIDNRVRRVPVAAMREVEHTAKSFDGAFA